VAVRLQLTEKPESFVCGSSATSNANVCFTLTRGGGQGATVSCLSLPVRPCAPPGRLSLADAAKLFSSSRPCRAFEVSPKAMATVRYNLPPAFPQVLPGASFLLNNLTICDVPLTRASNVYEARWSLEEPSLAVPAPLLEELFPGGQIEGEPLRLPIELTNHRQLWLGDAVNVSPNGGIVIGRSALALSYVYLTTDTLKWVAMAKNSESGFGANYGCAACPVLHRYDLVTRSCVDLCGSYWFMSLDGSSQTCKNGLTATVLLGFGVLLLVGGEAALLLLDRSTWKGQGAPPRNN
jgi:hypothetical protein